MEEDQGKHLAYGRVIWARLVDRHGYSKERPGIIMTPSDRIHGDSPLLVMAITTSFTDPPPRWHVPLPWNPDPRRVGTRLAQRSAAVVDWLDTIDAAEVLDVKGQVPDKVMKRIEMELQRRAAQEADELT